MAINDRWHVGEKQPGGKQPRSAEYGCRERWQVRWRDQQGSQRKRSFARKLDAEAFETETRKQLKDGSYIDPAAGKVTFRECAEQWRQTRDPRQHDATTAQRIESAFRVHAYPVIGDYPMRTLAQRPSILRTWIAGMAGHPNTVRKVVGDVGQVFFAAVDDNIIPANPLARPPGGRRAAVEKPKAVKTEAVPWTAEQVAAVAAELPGHLAAMPYLGAACGLRQGEVFGLAKSDLDFLRRTVHVAAQVKIIDNQLHFGPTKTRKARDVQLRGPVLPELAEHIRRFPPVEVTLPWHDPRNPKMHGKPVTRELVFAWRGREAISRGNFNPVWRRAWRAAGVPDRGRLNGFHVTRHTAASAWLSAGVGLAKVAALLGDTQEVVLATYSHFIPGDEDRAGAAMEAFWAVPGTAPSARDVPRVNG